MQNWHFSSLVLVHLSIVEHCECKIWDFLYFIVQLLNVCSSASTGSLWMSISPLMLLTVVIIRFKATKKYLNNTDCKLEVKNLGWQQKHIWQMRCHHLYIDSGKFELVEMSLFENLLKIMLLWFIENFTNIIYNK